MAFKVILDTNNLRVVIDTDSLSPVTTFQNFKSVVTFTQLEGLLQYVDLTAANVFVDADTKNLYFTSQYNSPNAESISFSDAQALLTSLAKTDSTSVTEELAKALDKALSDAPVMSENLTKVVQYFREFSDAPSMSEAITSVDTGLGKSDSTSVTEDIAKLFETGFADTPTITESLTQSVSLAKADTSTLTDSQAFATALAKADTPTISEELAKLFSPAKSDTATVSESDAKDVGKAVDDSSVSNTPTTKTYEVTVATGTNVYGSGNKFYIDGLPSPGLILNEGFTYTFDQSDSSNSNHPLRFSITGNGTHNSGTEYTTNITTNGTPGSSGAYTRIEVTSSTPDLHYYCSNHSGMGAETSVQDDGDTTFDVTVATGVNNHGSGNKYYIDGVITPIVHLVAGNTYTFNQSDSSNSNHPFRFSETSNGSHASGTEYTTGVTTNGTPGSSGAFTRIQITNSTVTTLYYYCTNHSGMGGEVNSSIAEAGGLSLSESLSRIVAYIRTFTDAAALDDTASASDDLATESGIVKNNVLSVSDSPSLSTNKPNISDTYNVTESTELLVSLAKSETFGFSDAQTFNFSLAPSDSLSVSEVLSLGGQTIFADQLSVTETTNLNSADGVQDSTSIVENLVSEFGSALSDNISMSENSVHSFSKSLTDSATISESVSILFIPGGGSILNTAALNTFVLN